MTAKRVLIVANEAVSDERLAQCRRSFGARSGPRG